MKYNVPDITLSDLLNFFQELNMIHPDDKTSGNSFSIPLTPVIVEELRKAAFEQGNFLVLGDLIEKEAGRLAGMLAGNNKELHKLLTFLIRELLRNAPEHGRTNTMWIRGRYCSINECVDITVLDEGIGIFESITNNTAHREYITDNAAALQWALKAGISKAFRPSMKQTSNDEWANSGFGLYMVSEICKYLNGSFCIVSYGNYLLIDNQETKAGETFFTGTAVSIKIPAEKVKNAQDIISKIAAQGEKEAKTIRNAFKTASKPSKGLMENLHIQF